jgi:hypothetical protein
VDATASRRCVRRTSALASFSKLYMVHHYVIVARALLMCPVCCITAAGCTKQMTKAGMTDMLVCSVHVLCQHAAASKHSKPKHDSRLPAGGREVGVVGQLAQAADGCG